MIDVKTAVRQASGFLEEVLKEDGVRDIRLEEVELLENPAGPPVWSVTLSFLRRVAEPEQSPSAAPSIWFRAIPGTEREAKVVRVKQDGGVIGMRQWVTHESEY